MLMQHLLDSHENNGTLVHEGFLISPGGVVDDRVYILILPAQISHTIVEPTLTAILTV